MNMAIPLGDNYVLPDMSDFSPEENYIILSVGAKCLLESRKFVSGLTHNEIYEKIKAESIKEIEKLELDILVERETSKNMKEEIVQIYARQIEQLTAQHNSINEQLKKQNNSMYEQLKNYELDNNVSLLEEVNKVKEKCEIQVREKEKQVERLTETYEKLNETLILQKGKSISAKGSEGEKQFSDYAETFIDFKDFEIIDKHTQSGDGDFHLHFEEFDVLVDAKNYKNKVPSNQREKIKNDLLKNEHINFAWLVSLNTTIDKFDKCPIMSEWITTDKCIVYINNLKSYEDPKKILRVAWFYCNDLMKFINKPDNNSVLSESDGVISELKNRQFKMLDKIKNARKNIREMNTTLGIFKKQIDTLDYELKEILNIESENILNSNFSLFDEWWKNSIEWTGGGELVLSTDIWTQFKHDNKESIKEFNITVDNCKEYIRSKVSSDSILLRSNGKGAFEIKGLKWKVREKKSISAKKEKMELELVNSKA